MKVYLLAVVSIASRDPAQSLPKSFSSLSLPSLRVVWGTDRLGLGGIRDAEVINQAVDRTDQPTKCYA